MGGPNVNANTISRKFAHDESTIIKRGGMACNYVIASPFTSISVYLQLQYRAPIKNLLTKIRRLLT